MNTNATSPQGQEELLTAAKQGSIAAFKRLLATGINPDVPAKNGDTAMYLAAKYRNFEIVQILIAAGADPNGHKDKAPLFPAVGDGSTKMVTALLAAGARVDLTTKSGTTLMHLAAESSQTIAKLLLRAGAPTTGRDSDGNTPLHRAACCSSAMTRLLVKRGADIDARTNTGLTPALTAAFHGQPTFEVLISLGADPLARDAQGRSAFELSLVQDHHELALHILREHPTLAPTGKALDDALVKAVCNGWTPLAKKLAAFGADLGQKPGGRTLLQCAPRDAEELKRLLRSHRTSVMIDSAMDAGSEPPLAAPSRSPSIL